MSSRDPIPGDFPGWVLLGLALSMLGACSDEARGKPQADPVQKTSSGPARVYHDYGTLELGTKKTHDFVVPVPANEHGDVILHDSFSGDCSCAIGLLKIADASGTTDRAVWGLPSDHRTVRPGEKVILRLTLDTKNKEAVDLPRTLSRGRVGFQLTSGDHARYESVIVEFHYGIRTPIRSTPVAHVDFGKLPMSSKYHQTLELTSNLPGRELDLGEPVASPQSVAARLERTGDKALLHITVTPVREGLRRLQGVVTMSTGIDAYPDLKIPVTGTFIGDIEYEPAETISFNLFDFRQTKERFVNLIDHDKSRPREFAFLSLLDTNGLDISKHFEVRFEALSGRKVRAVVKYLGTMGGIRMGGWLSLAKPGSDEPVARIRLVGHNSRK